MERGAVIPCREKSGPMEVLGGGGRAAEARIVRGLECHPRGVWSLAWPLRTQGLTSGVSVSRGKLNRKALVAEGPDRGID